MSKCLSVFEQITWYASRTTALQRSTDWKYPSIDFNFWVMYGSWSFCDDCGSYWFNDGYFRQRVYQDQDSGETPDALAAFRREVPTDPLDHDEAGVVGYSSRWWYRSGMYKPVAYCSHCTRPTPGLSSGARFAEALRERHGAAQERAENAGIAGPVERTGQLYRIPRIRTAACREKPWSQECVTWPRYQHGRYSFANEAQIQTYSGKCVGHVANCITMADHRHIMSSPYKNDRKHLEAVRGAAAQLFFLFYMGKIEGADYLFCLRHGLQLYSQSLMFSVVRCFYRHVFHLELIVVIK